jgi:hypothetical protein
MKAKVIIENGITTVELKADNEFERDVIEKFVNKRERFVLNTNISTKESYGTHSEHKITITVEKSEPKNK